MDPEPSYTPPEIPPNGWDFEDDLSEYSCDYESEYNPNHEQVTGVPADLDDDFEVHLFNCLWGINTLTASGKDLGDSQLVGGDQDLHEFNELWGWIYGTLPFST